MTVLVLALYAEGPSDTRFLPPIIYINLNPPSPLEIPHLHQCNKAHESQHEPEERAVVMLHLG